MDLSMEAREIRMLGLAIGAALAAGLLHLLRVRIARRQDTRIGSSPSQSPAGEPSDPELGGLKKYSASMKT